MAWTAVLASFLIMAGCEPPVSLPPEPRLTEVALTTEGDIGQLSIGFEDGDGNFGLDQADTTDAFCPTCPFHHNVFCSYEELRDGEWTPIPLDPAIGQVPFFYRAPRIEPTGQNKALEGHHHRGIGSPVLPHISLGHCSVRRAHRGPGPPIERHPPHRLRGQALKIST